MAKKKPKFWIKGAIKKPGSFSKAAASAGMSTQAYASKKASSPGILGKRARLAQTLAKLRKGKRKK